METINVRLPHEQVASMDKLVKRLNYASRSEFVREALRGMSEKWTDLSQETIRDIEAARRKNSESSSHGL